MKPKPPFAGPPNVVEWAETNWLDEQTREPIRLRPWQKTALLAIHPADGSAPRWTTFLISTVKKAGKTTINAIATAYAALTFPAPEEVICLANDEAQAQERVFDMIAGAFRRMVEHGLASPGEFTITKSEIVIRIRDAAGFYRETKIKSVAADFAGAAGGNYGVTSWTELWAFRHEGHVRLWEEMPPLPVGLARHHRSLRIVDSYAGFDGDAPILQPLWERAMKGERVEGELPVFTDGDLWAYIDQGEAAQSRAWGDTDPELVAAYYREEAKANRPGTYARLHLNRWQQGEEDFITAESYDACVRLDLRPLVSDLRLEIFAGADAATRRDCAAVVAVARVIDDGHVRYRIVRHRIWVPKRGETLDLEDTVEAYLLDLARSFRLRLASYDPHQMVRSAQALSKAGLRMEPYNQTSGNLTLAGQNLYDLLTAQQLEIYPDAELRRHFLNAVAVRSGRGWKLAKEKTANKIDACVATSFAALAAVSQAVGSWHPLDTPEGYRDKGMKMHADGTLEPLSEHEIAERDQERRAARQNDDDPRHDPNRWFFIG